MPKKMGARRSIPKMPAKGSKKTPTKGTANPRGAPNPPVSRMRRPTKGEVKASPAVKRNKKRRSAY